MLAVAAERSNTNPVVALPTLGSSEPDELRRYSVWGVREYGTVNEQMP